jgi:uncharacterized protein YraI
MRTTAKQEVCMKTSTLTCLFIIAGLLPASCAGQAPIPQSKSIATPSVQDPATPAPPAIHINPDVLSANTQMTVMGEGFPAETRVRVYLSVPNLGDTTQSYGEAVTNAEGKLAFVFPMPDRWPNGALITEKVLVLIIANEDYGLRVTAPFDFQPAPTPQPTPTPPQAAPTPTVVTAPTHTPSARVNYEFLNIRSGPGITYTLLISLQQNAPLSLLGRNDDNTWVRIRLPDGREGWAYSQYLEASVAIASLPLVTVSSPTQELGLPPATAPAVPANEQGAALASAVGFYTLWASGTDPYGKLDEALQHVSKSLADQIRADNSSLLRMVGVQSRPLYTQVEIQSFDGTTALIRAALQLESGGSHSVDTTLAKENGAWVIVKFQPVTQ